MRDCRGKLENAGNTARQRLTLQCSTFPFLLFSMQFNGQNSSKIAFHEVEFTHGPHHWPHSEVLPNFAADSVQLSGFTCIIMRKLVKRDG